MARCSPQLYTLEICSFASFRALYAQKLFKGDVCTLR